MYMIPDHHYFHDQVVCIVHEMDDSQQLIQETQILDIVR